MKKLFAGLLSLITIGAMLLNGIPTTTHAVDETATPNTDTASIVSEDVSKRGMYEKHFLMSDGSYTVTAYDEPVHQFVNGAWTEVDNTLQLTANADGVSQYKTVNGITEVSFATKFDSELITMRQGDYSLSWDITAVPENSNHISNTVTATKVDAQIIPLDLTGMSEEEVKTVATKATSTVRYNDALGQGVDVEYIVTPSKVKENIILDSPKDFAGYLITLYTENLSARLLENNQIELYNTDGEVIFTVHSPYMYDSAGSFSEDFTLQMLPKGTGCYILAMEPDADWLSDPDRVYPVTIDPLVSPSNIRENIIDNYVKESQGVQNNNLDRLYVGKLDGYTVRSYIKFKEMPFIPIGATIRNARITLTIVSGTILTQPINAYMVTGSDWASGTITWANCPSASTLIASNVSPNTSMKYQITCVNAVESWYNGNHLGKNNNFGIMVRASSETGSANTAFYSADCMDAASRPALAINYEPVDGSFDIVWPVPNHYYVTSEFGYRSTVNTPRMHRGIDISCVVGTTLVAAISGKIRYVEGPEIGYGIVVYQPHPFGDVDSLGNPLPTFQAHYYHLPPGPYLVADGANVAVGTMIAYSGNTGLSDGAHLHFQLQYGTHDQLYNPLEVYHPTDSRYGQTNPNPMFYYANYMYYPNPYFDFTYTPSYYNAVHNTPNG